MRVIRFNHFRDVVSVCSVVENKMLAEFDVEEASDIVELTRDLRIVFSVRIESRIESAVRFDFESNFRIESAVYTTHIPSVFILYL